MTPPINLSLRVGDLWVRIEPTEGDRFKIEVVAMVSHLPVSDVGREAALKEALRALSDVRAQIWEMLGGSRR